MTMKNDAKLEEELTCHFKIDIIILNEFWSRHLEASKKNHFNVLLLIKVFIVWAKKVQSSYFLWNWRGQIQYLERNRLVISKLTKGIWQILTWALKSHKMFHFNGLPLSKVYIVWAKKLQRSYLSWH